MSDELDQSYRILGLEPGATLGAVLRAYSRLALDRSLQDEDGASAESSPVALQTLNEAYERLQRHLRGDASATPSVAPQRSESIQRLSAVPKRMPTPAPLPVRPVSDHDDALDDDFDEAEAPRRAYWETGDADQDLVEGGGVTLDDATFEWLKRAAMIAAIALLVYAMVQANRSGI